jgi:ribosome recycling factor
MTFTLEQYHPALRKIVDHFGQQLKTIRTSRATPSLVEGIRILAYQTMTPLAQLASITAPDSRTIIVQPWDATILKAIEGAIRDSDLGIEPRVDQKVIRLTMASLTEENRKKLVKLTRERLEEAKVSLRQERDMVKSEILKAEKQKEFSEDERFRLLKKLDERIVEFSEKLTTLANQKEAEIMTI